MSRTGIEPKPPWSVVPTPVKARVEATLGSPVQRASRVWGGYGPTPTFRLRLANGGRAFFKAINAESNEFMHTAFGRELRFYDELRPLFTRWCPKFLGAFDLEDWRVILLEDLGPKSAPPWTPSLARKTIGALAEFHQHGMGVQLPDWVRQESDWIRDGGAGWHWLDGPQYVRSVASIAGQAADAAFDWLVLAGPGIREAAWRLAEPGLPQCLQHGDVRSDNLRVRDGRLYLFDWPHITAGTAETDVVLFIETITVEGGPLPEQLMPAYESSLALDPELVRAAICATLGMFLDWAWQPEIPGLPRVRRFHGQQVRALIEWLCRITPLPDASWVRAIPGSDPEPSAG
jgi:hypothetical protein